MIKVASRFTTAVEGHYPGNGPGRDSIGESRLITVGSSSNGKLLVVSHTESVAEIRMISARLATAHERKAYES